MAQKYKLKKEVYKYFPIVVHDKILTIHQWSLRMVIPTMLDPVSRVCVEYEDILHEIASEKTIIKLSVFVSDSTGEEYRSVNMAEVVQLVQSALDKHFSK